MKNSVALLLSLIFLTGTTLLGGVPKDPVKKQNPLAEAQRILETYVKENNVPGLSAAIAVQNEVLWTGGFGYANLQHMVPAGSHTLYRIASISKPITAVLAMQLVEAGKLDLDKPIKEYLPLLHGPIGTITTRQLLCHTSGIRHYRGDEFLSDIRHQSVLTPLSVFADDTLLFAPGERFSYTTFGYTLLSAVMEAAAGRSFLEKLNQNLVQPLGLSALGPEESEQIIPNLASFYLRRREGIINAPFVDNSNKWAGGGLISTAGDLVKFAMHLMQGDLIKPETLEKMFTLQQTNAGDTLEFSLGWRVDIDEETGVRAIWHTGGAMGGGGVLFIFPDQGIIFASLANTNRVTHLQLARRIARLFLNPSDVKANE